jgi:hypothetical protein
MRRRGPARARVLFLCLALLLTAGCRRQDTLPPARQIPLAAPVSEGATLAVDSAGLLWIGTPGRLTAVDTAGRAVGTVTLARDSVPRVLWRAGPRLVLRDGRRISGADAAGGAAVAGYGSTGLRAAARDPRNRWVFTANRRGGVMGLDPASLQPRWSWPETGGEALGMAVSPLADRVYVSVDRAGDLSAAVQVRDAGSGRVLTSVEMDEPLRALAAGPDGTLYGLSDGAVVRLRPGPGGLRRVWTEAPSIGASGDQVEMRMDPSGARVAVFGRGRGARLAVLDARTGRVLGVTKTAPLDAAFGAEGRLYLLEQRMIREVR